MKFELTKRELEIYKLLATTNLSYKEIGDFLKIAESTVKTHRVSIYLKYMFRSRADLTRHYYQEINGQLSCMLEKMKSAEDIRPLS